REEGRVNRSPPPARLPACAVVHPSSRDHGDARIRARTAALSIPWATALIESLLFPLPSSLFPVSLFPLPFSLLPLFRRRRHSDKDDAVLQRRFDSVRNPCRRPGHSTSPQLAYLRSYSDPRLARKNKVEFVHAVVSVRALRLAPREAIDPGEEPRRTKAVLLGHLVGRERAAGAHIGYEIVSCHDRFLD